MDLGTRRRLRRERLRQENPTTLIDRDDPRLAWLAVGLVIAGSVVGGAGHVPIGTELERLYCTSGSCAALPQVLTGWAIAVVPLAVYLWRDAVAALLAMFLFGFMGTLFITSNQDVPVETNPITGLWPLPLTYFVVGLLFVPFSLAISRLVRPGRRAPVVAAQHWVLLAGLVIWLA